MLGIISALLLFRIPNFPKEITNPFANDGLTSTHYLRGKVITHDQENNSITMNASVKQIGLSHPLLIKYDGDTEWWIQDFRSKDGTLYNISLEKIKPKKIPDNSTIVIDQATKESINSYAGIIIIKTNGT